MLWDSGCTHYINPYSELYKEYKPLEKGDDTEVNIIGGIINNEGVVIAALDLKEDTGKIHNLAFKQVYYFPLTSKLLSSPHKWAQDRG